MRWIRLDVAFDESWLFALSAGAQLAWVKMLCTVKRDGVKGKMKAISPLVAARKWGVGEEDVVKMLKAGADDGAIVSDGQTWTITNWSRFQESDTTGAERQKKYREKRKITRKKEAPKQEPEPQENATFEPETVTDSNGVTTVTHRDEPLPLSRDIDIDTCSDTSYPHTPNPLEGAECGDPPDELWFVSCDPDTAQKIVQAMRTFGQFEFCDAWPELGFRKLADEIEGWGATAEDIEFELDSMREAYGSKRYKPNSIPLLVAREWFKNRESRFKPKTKRAAVGSDGARRLHELAKEIRL